MSEGDPRSPSDQRQHVLYLLAIIAAGTVILLTLVFYLLEHDAGEGWFADFAKHLVPEIAGVALVSLVGYMVLTRVGLSRDDQLVDRIAALVPSEAAGAQGLQAFYQYPGDIPWDELLTGATKIVVGAPWLATWTTNHAMALERFFTAGGTAEIYMLDPANIEVLTLAAERHAGFNGNGDTAAVTHKIITSTRRLVSAAGSSPRGRTALTLRFLDRENVQLSQTLFHITGPERDLLVMYAFDNFRNAQNRSPAFVVDLFQAHQVAAFATSELAGFRRCSRAVDDDAIDAIIK